MRTPHGTRKILQFPGFTLIELLIVISIIALLAAILFPVFARARESARRAACQSNLKQIGMGVMQYTQDYDEMYPAQTENNGVNYYADTSAAGWAENWIWNTQPYIRSWQVFRCPSLADTPDAATRPAGNSATGYFGNGILFRQFGLNQTAVSETASIIMAHEYILATNRSYLRPTSDGAAVGKFREPMNETWDEIHFEGANLLFADGHVKWRKATTIGYAEFGLTNPSAAAPDKGPVSSTVEFDSAF